MIEHRGRVDHSKSVRRWKRKKEGFDDTGWGETVEAKLGVG